MQLNYTSHGLLVTNHNPRKLTNACGDRVSAKADGAIIHRHHKCKCELKCRVHLWESEGIDQEMKLRWKCVNEAIVELGSLCKFWTNIEWWVRAL